VYFKRCLTHKRIIRKSLYLFIWSLHIKQSSDR